MDVIVESVEERQGEVVVRGEVPARCALGYYKVQIAVKDGRLVWSSCECGEPICPHAVKLFLRYRARGSRLPPKA